MSNHRRRMRPLLGTYVEIGVKTSSGDQSADHMIGRAFLAVEQVQQLLNRHDEKSELAKLNQSTGEVLALHPISLAVLRLARFVSRHSGGVFFTGAEALELNSKHVRRTNFATTITLDGIAKGYAVDLAVRELRKSGASEGWVNAGGDLKVFGDLTLPIHRREKGGFKVIGGLRNAAVATSEVTKDPSFQGRIRSQAGVTPPEGIWTVLARNAWLADALTKVAALSIPSERVAIVSRLGGQLVVGSPS